MKRALFILLLLISLIILTSCGKWWNQVQGNNSNNNNSNNNNSFNKFQGLDRYKYLNDLYKRKCGNIINEKEKEKCLSIIENESRPNDMFKIYEQILKTKAWYKCNKITGKLKYRCLDESYIEKALEKNDKKMCENIRNKNLIKICKNLIK